VGCYIDDASTNLLAVGIVVERWDGRSWSLQPAPDPTDVMQAQLAGVSCTSATACVSVGRTVQGFQFGEGPLAERWNGKSWSIQSTVGAPLSTELLGVSCVSATACTAVGDGNFSTPVVEVYRDVTHPAGTASAGRATVSNTTASVPVRCTGVVGATCTIALRLTITETFRGKKLIAIAATNTTKIVTVGTATMTTTAGHIRIVRVRLNQTGLRLLAHRPELRVKLRIAQVRSNGAKLLATQTISFAMRQPRSHRE
jgi:hypothetical protein